MKITAEGGAVSVAGPKGTLKFPLHSALKVEVAGALVKVHRSGDTRETRTFHGLTRAMIANMVTGVTSGYERKLEINGVGWGAKVEGKDVVLTIGFCNPVRIAIPQGVTVEAPQPTNVVVKGIDKQMVGSSQRGFARFARRSRTTPKASNTPRKRSSASKASRSVRRNQSRKALARGEPPLEPNNPTIIVTNL